MGFAWGNCGERKLFSKSVPKKNPRLFLTLLLIRQPDFFENVLGLARGSVGAEVYDMECEVMESDVVLTCGEWGGQAAAAEEPGNEEATCMSGEEIVERQG